MRNVHSHARTKELKLHVAGCFSSTSQARAIRLEDLPKRSEPQALLMCSPSQFTVIDVKNAFMKGNINKTNLELATRQWKALRQTFEKLGHHVDVIRVAAGREDMVFTANSVLLGKGASGHKFVVAANMVHDSRRKEIPYFERWFAARGYRVLKLEGKTWLSPYFEGQGDSLWHPGLQLLWGGWGHRSELRAFEELCKLIDVPILTIKLVHPNFYHLDTALCPLDKQTVMYYPKAFNAAGNDLIQHFFKNAIAISDADAFNFACNALALGKHVVIQKGSSRTCAQLRQHGFTPVEVETSEFMKSGGSVSCLKMLTYEGK
jgi:N-dimethylarginine dimethylaminohydrolase